MFFPQQSYHTWQLIFWILAGTYISAALVFAVFGSGEMQPWNNPPEKVKDVVSAEEGAPLTNGDATEKIAN